MANNILAIRYACSHYAGRAGSHPTLHPGIRQLPYAKPHTLERVFSTSKDSAPELVAGRDFEKSRNYCEACYSSLGIEERRMYLEHFEMDKTSGTEMVVFAPSESAAHHGDQAEKVAVRLGNRTIISRKDQTKSRDKPLPALPTPNSEHEELAARTGSLSPSIAGGGIKTGHSKLIVRRQTQSKMRGRGNNCRNSPATGKRPRLASTHLYTKDTITRSRPAAESSKLARGKTQGKTWEESNCFYFHTQEQGCARCAEARLNGSSSVSQHEIIKVVSLKMAKAKMVRIRKPKANLEVDPPKSVESDHLETPAILTYHEASPDRRPPMFMEDEDYGSGLVVLIATGPCLPSITVTSTTSKTRTLFGSAKQGKSRGVPRAERQVLTLPHEPPFQSEFDAFDFRF